MSENLIEIQQWRDGTWTGIVYAPDRPYKYHGNTLKKLWKQILEKIEEDKP